MSRVLDLYRSTVGKKIGLAVTGVMMVGFLAVHLGGNLLIFFGPGKIEAYSRGLRAVPMALWVIRAVLIVATIVHIVAAVQLGLTNWRARPVAYRRQRIVHAGYAARTMLWSGPMIGLFVAYHVLQFNFGVMHPDFDVADVGGNVKRLFAIVPVSMVYLAALFALAFHLSHGAWSMFHSLGIQHRAYLRPLRHVAAAITFIVVAGYAVIPIAVLLGILE